MHRFLICTVQVLALFLCFNLATVSAADTFPSRQIRIVVPFAAGGAVDAIARKLAQKLTLEWHQQVIVENRAGASGTIGANVVAKSRPDGYTLLFGPSTLVVSPFILKDYASLDPQKDLLPLALVAKGPLLFVISSKAARQPTSVQAFIADAKSHPDDYNFATGGYGSAGHLAAEYFKSRAGVKIPVVLYRGTAPAITDLLGGQVSAMLDPLLTSLPQAKSGGVHAVAITSDEPSPLAPGVPTMAQAGFLNFDFFTWYGLWAPRDLPPDLAKKLEAATEKNLALPDMRDWFASQGLEAGKQTGQSFATFIQNEVAKYRDIITTGKIAPQ